MVATIMVVVMAAGCRSPQPVALAGTQVTHTTHTLVDTVYITLPQQTAMAHTIDSLSVLTTEYAGSEARINPDGSLTHRLRTLPTPVAVPVTTTHTHTDSVVTIISQAPAEKAKQSPGGVRHLSTVVVITLLALLVLRLRWR